MKVLCILPVKIGFDGMTKQILSLYRFMDKADVEVDLVSCRGYDERLKPQVEKAGFKNIYRLEYRDNNQLKYFLSLIKIMKKRKYDVIHVNGQSATMFVEMFAAILAGCKKRVAHSHSSRCLHVKIHNLLKPFFLKSYTDAIACSEEAGEWLFCGKPYYVLKNGVDLSEFTYDLETRTRVRNELGISDNTIAVGNVAAFEPWKNHKFMVDLFSELQNEDREKYHLFLWGIDGTTKEETIKRIQDKGLEDTIHVMGSTNHISDYLQAMDLMLLPSWYEGFPVTVVEWQAAGLRCIVSDRVTKTANITGLVDYLPIEEYGAGLWKEKILSFDKNEYDRAHLKEDENLKEFDIRHTAGELKQILGK